jgi:hypothetical protein
MRVRRRLALLLLSAPALAHASLTGADVAEIRGAIYRHLASVPRGEACGAALQPARLAFSELVLMGPDVVQQVRIVDRTGGLWTAYFPMERQQDGTWRTDGCRLAQPARAVSA